MRSTRAEAVTSPPHASGRPGRELELRAPLTRGRALGLILSLATVLAVSLPAFLRGGLDAFDGALFAHTGEFFRTMAREPLEFLSSPREWMWAYYDQYPALAVRRHPPVFPLVEAAVYSVTGFSIFGTRLTALLFSAAFGAGFYVLCARIFKREMTALAAVVVLV